MNRQWWHRENRVAHFDLYTRSTLYALSGSVPLVVLGLLTGERAPAGVMAAVLAACLLQTAACLVLVHQGLARYRDLGPWPRTAVVAAAAVTVAAGTVEVLVVPDRSVGWLAAIFTVLAFIAALSVAVAIRVTLLVIAGVLALAIVLPMPDPIRLSWWVSVTFGSVGVLGGYRGSLWMLGIVWELDRARGAQAELAVAEERLRFSRDLHDVVGRGLAVVALKSELAAQLSRRGRDEAAAEMLEVRRLAQELLTEVRELVRGYRMTDLEAELAGARSVLASAGIAAEIRSEGGPLPAGAQGTLGWVVREGTTNVLRHSDARTCTISVGREDGMAVLAMENDGVRYPGRAGAGSGLVGLRERLTSSGGTLVAEHRPEGRFLLAARVPLTEPSLEPVPSSGPAPSSEPVPSSDVPSSDVPSSDVPSSDVLEPAVER